ncbi:Putative membrane protein [Streptomyces venezuelae]|uniref:HTTM domain-containing protein n=1 Tax=Streptomyces gardneri TaxID=66892 RepID=UPI0006BC4264|nr:HTTM domain-containing protein [Streptomyces gardneri]ALO09621.1 Putative membrane protein [Streptomyces venezuelae]QPK46703.1 HTTM domain-containing protein [Streptomyces gardneri]WRK38099.1 HTTM domain-containing protein [Streptomyces venezuelae]CUM39948.1 putative membrane protein [Streptomyces venezuelae]
MSGPTDARVRTREPFDRRIARAVQAVTGRALGPHQTAIVRIGFSLTWLVFLLRELPHRHEMYGPDGPWSWELASRLIADNRAFTVLMWSDGRVWFELVYGLAVLSAALLLVGWHTRAVSVVFMVGVLSLQNRSVFLGDGGDNVLHLAAIYLVLTRCGQVWSLDARRAAREAARDAARRAAGETDEAAEVGGRRDVVGPLLWTVLGGFLLATTWFSDVTGEWWLPVLLWVLWLGHGLWWLACRLAPGEPRTLLDVLANLTHNAALVVIMAEVCLIYATAGWYKIQGSRWQDGTALYYPLHLDYFSPWPELSELLGSSGIMVLLLTYGTVIVQIAFPFTLFHRKVKNVLLVAMMLEHAGIAVLLGLPVFSLAMISADAVFLPTVFLVALGARAARGRDRLLGRRSAGALPEQRRTAEEHGPRTLVG